MSPTALSSLVAFVAAGISLVAAQATYPATPLASKSFPYPTGIPYKADTDDHLIRGHQIGYNLCNTTTSGQDSLCQTSYLNSISDFCLWGPPAPDSVVADHEGEMVAWCTTPDHGARLIPAGALQGVQFMKTPDYVQVVGFLDQKLVNIQTEDWGGEMDPHGADLRGNPLGGLFYSNAFGGTYKQVIEWHNFIGANYFCLKACDPAGPNAAHFCEHVFDRIGCHYNAPSHARNGTFEACEGENQDFPGTYTLDGQVHTYTQPPEHLGAILTMPYQPRVPASSNCVEHTSSVLYSALATVTHPIYGAAPTTTSGSSSGPAAGTGGSTRSTAGGPSPTGTQGSSETPTNGADALVISGLSILGVVFSAVFLS